MRNTVIQNNIGWCDETTNGVTGCDKVSLGCKNCYAAVGTRARVLRHRKVNPIETWGANGQRVPVNFEPVFRRLNKLCICDKCHETGSNTLPWACSCSLDGTRRSIRLFADSNSDWLDPKWPVETLARFLDAIRNAPNVDVLLLTKRIENWRERVTQAMLLNPFINHSAVVTGPEFFSGWCRDWLDGKPPANIWHGVSVEDNQRRDRIPLLRGTPAAVRFISFEPLLEDLPKLTLEGIQWAIVGGESGKNRRDCGVEAIESVALQCVHAGVPVYVKQDSAFMSGQKGRLSDNAWSFKQFPR